MTNQELMSAMQASGRLIVGHVGDTEPKRTKITAQAVRRLLEPGAEFRAEFIGINAKIGKPEHRNTLRKVRKQSSRTMVSVFIESDLPGEEVWLNWKNVRAEKEGEAIILIMTELKPEEEFLKITNIRGPQ